jgi:hypothetical protein
MIPTPSDATVRSFKAVLSKPQKSSARYQKEDQPEDLGLADVSGRPLRLIVCLFEGTGLFDFYFPFKLHLIQKFPVHTSLP